jgi:hypothetical protein
METILAVACRDSPWEWTIDFSVLQWRDPAKLSTVLTPISLLSHMSDCRNEQVLGN